MIVYRHICQFHPAYTRSEITNTMGFLYSDVTLSAMASQIIWPVCSAICSGAHQRSSASLASVRGIHRWSVDCPHDGPVTRKMFPYNDVIVVKMLLSLKNWRDKVTILHTCKTVAWFDIQTITFINLQLWTKFFSWNGSLVTERPVSIPSHASLMCYFTGNGAMT